MLLHGGVGATDGVMNGGLRILFDLAFDNHAWPGPLVASDRTVDAVTGELWLGPLGLLARLEAELGLAGLHASELERTSHLVKQLASRQGWWRGSYDADPLGTCQRLLADRDALVGAGWCGELVSDRLAELWSVTCDALPGTGERLAKVAQTLATQRTDVQKITLQTARNELSVTWRNLYKALELSGVHVTEAHKSEDSISHVAGDLGRLQRSNLVPGSVSAAGDGSLTLLRSHGPVTAADEVAAGLAALPSLDGVLVVGGDDVLDAALHRHGLPRLGLGARPPASTSLVRLVMEAAFEPMSPADLHALLVLNPGPIPRRVSGPLIRALREFPSRRAPRWKEALAQGLALCDDQWRSEVEGRIAALVMPVAAQAESVSVEKLCRRLDALAQWARARVAQTPTLASVLALSEQAGEALRSCGANELSVVALRRVGDALDESRLSSRLSEAGLAAVLEPGCVMGPAKHVVWWGFTRASTPTPMRLRLSNQERLKLRDLGISPPEPGAVMQQRSVQWRRPLLMARDSLVLVCPMTSDAGEQNFVHPLWDELSSMLCHRGDVLRLQHRQWPGPADRRPVEVIRPLSLPSPSLRTGKAIALRERESPSGLEDLLSCSLKWALKYHGKLYPGGADGPDSPSPLLYGKIAHHVLAEVFAPPAGNSVRDADTAEARAVACVDQWLSSLSESLSLPRYQVERATTRRAVVQAARKIGELIASSGARVRGVELELTGVLFGLLVAGRADMVLAQPDMVLDFKWGQSRPSDALRSGTALQLGVYSALLSQNGTQTEVAYLILRNQALLAPSSSNVKGAQTLGRSPAQDTLSGAFATLAERQQQLAEGVLLAPPSDGSNIKSSLSNGRLTLSPRCEYCDFGVVCGLQASL
jgi:ATP-dependent helicase/nuclease subunit B